MTELESIRKAITNIVTNIENELYLRKIYIFADCIHKKELEDKGKNNGQAYKREHTG